MVCLLSSEPLELIWEKWMKPPTEEILTETVEEDQAKNLLKRLKKKPSSKPAEAKKSQETKRKR